MKKFLFTAVLLTALILPAQVKDTLETGSFAGKKAIIFNFNNFSLDAFEGGIGLKYWKSNQTAVIVRLGVSVIKSEKEKSAELMGEENSAVEAGIDFGIERHVKINKKFSPYWGAVIGAGYERVKRKIVLSERLHYYDFSTGHNNGTTAELISVRLKFNIGIEYFLHKQISLVGQYSFGGLYKFGTEEIISNIVDVSRRVSELNTGISSSSLILAIYF